MRALTAEPDPHRKLVRYAAIGRSLWDRTGPLLTAIMAGAHAGDRDLTELVATIRRESLAGATGLVGHLADAGVLRPCLSREQARDELWLLIQPETYLLLVTERGWSHDQMERWLARTAAHALL